VQVVFRRMVCVCVYRCECIVLAFVSSHCHVVTHCSVLRSLSCPIHHSLLPPHLCIPTQFHTPQTEGGAPPVDEVEARRRLAAEEEMLNVRLTRWDGMGWRWVSVSVSVSVCIVSLHTCVGCKVLKVVCVWWILCSSMGYVHVCRSLTHPSLLSRHIVTRCSVLPSLSCPLHHSLLPPHLFIPNFSDTPSPPHCRMPSRPL
jgi:hypothetical protein